MGTPKPHPDYPVGTVVRIRPMAASARPAKRRLAGMIGTVIISSSSLLVVAFPGERFREHFTPGQLEPSEPEGA